MAREQAVITKGVGSDHRSRPAAVVQLAHRLHAVVQEIRRRGAIVLPCAEPVAIISSCQRRPVRRHPVLMGLFILEKVATDYQSHLEKVSVS